MLRYSCIIVEDEPLAAEVLADYVKQVPFLDLKGICEDALYAVEMMKKEKIDVIFLDIHLPKLKGLDFIKTLTQSPQIIITSAYNEYALQGYELNVVDYLLKPVEFSRFLTAVNKLTSAPQSKTPERPYMFFNVSKKKVKVFLDEIIYIESLKEYVRIVTENKSIVTKLQIGQAEELLPAGQFIRTHRSFIVARDKVEAFSATDIEVKGKQIPIGRNYLEQVKIMLEEEKN